MALKALVPREGVARVRDRLLMTVFVAAVVHGMVILGLTFGAGPHHAGAAPGLDVLLVSDELPAADHNDTAAYLAQRTQLGAGTASAPIAPHRPDTAGLPPRPRPDPGPGSTQATAVPGGERVLTTSASGTQVRWLGAEQGAAPASDAARPPAVPEGLPGADTGAVQLRGPRRDDPWISPDTRESELAPYLDGWRRRVERIGTLNYPAAARHDGVTASPVLEVQIDASGRLGGAAIRRSSGYPDLDQAALEILKMASPFDPFPAALRDRYRTLRFAYEWQFTGGPGGGALAVSQ